MKKFICAVMGALLMYIASAITFWRYELISWEIEGNSITFDFLTREMKEAFWMFLPVLGVVIGVLFIGAIIIALLHRRGKPEYSDEEEE